MAAGPFEVYHKGLLKIIQQSINFFSDTIKVAILTSSYTPDLAVDEFWDEISANECVDGDYAQLTLGSKVFDLQSGKIRFDAANLDWGNSVSITGKYIVILKDTGNPATSPLIWLLDLNTSGGSVSSTNSDFDVAIAATGIYEITPNV